MQEGFLEEVPAAAWALGSMWGQYQQPHRSLAPVSVAPRPRWGPLGARLVTSLAEASPTPSSVPIRTNWTYMHALIGPDFVSF